MTDYEVTEMMSKIQMVAVGISVPQEFNQLIISKLNESSRNSLERALDDLGSEEVEVLQKQEALKAVLLVSKAAHDAQVFNDVCNKWLADEQYEAGVCDTGEIVLWDKEKPESRIVMREQRG